MDPKPVQRVEGVFVIAATRRERHSRAGVWLGREHQRPALELQRHLNRGYSVTVSANARDNGAWINKNSSNNWGANVHIVTHTNGIVGCPESFQYLLVMYRTGFWGSTDLRDHLLAKLDPVLPGGQNTWNCDNLLECTQVNAAHRAYVELFFHTNQASVNWFQTAGVPEANTWRYGYAVDDHLNYP